MKRAKVKGSSSISLRSTQPLEADSQRSYIPASSFQKLRRLSRRTFAPLPHPRGRALSHQLSYTIPRPSSCCQLIRNWSLGSSLPLVTQCSSWGPGRVVSTLIGTSRGRYSLFLGVCSAPCVPGPDWTAFGSSSSPTDRMSVDHDPSLVR